MKQETRTLPEFIEDNYTDRLGYRSHRIRHFADEYSNMHATLLTMDSKTGTIRSVKEALKGLRAVAKGISYEQLVKEKQERNLRKSQESNILWASQACTVSTPQFGTDPMSDSPMMRDMYRKE